MATTITPAILAAEFPEFDDVVTAQPVKVQAKIDDAERRTNEATWGELFDDGVKYLACHLIAMSPLGEQSKLMIKQETTEYLLEYKRMQRSVASGCRVI